MSYAEDPAAMFRCSPSAASRAARMSAQDERGFSVGSYPHLPP